MEVTDSLKRFRKEFKLTQQEVANSVGMTQSSYARYEQGAREPAYRKLRGIAEVFNVSLDYLVGRTDNPIMIR